MTAPVYDFFGNVVPVSNYPKVVFKSTGPDQTVVGTSDRDAFYGSYDGVTLVGGAGDDTYIVQQHDVTVVEGAGAGVDTVKAYQNYVLAPNVENLFVLGYSGYSGTTGFGNAGANLITGDVNNQYLEGMGGNDVLVGGGGSDTFTFRPNSGYDAINDFQTGAPAAGGDVIRLAPGYGIFTFADFQAHLTQQGADSLLTLSPVDKVLIRNTSVGDFTEDNFHGPVDVSQYKLTFDEEFNSPISWYDTKTKTGRWLPEYGYGGIGTKSSHDVANYTGELEIYVDPSYGGKGTTPLGLNPFNQHDGVIEINSGLIPDEDKDALWDFDYYSGMLSSVQSFQQTYGYFEMRARLPAEPGGWAGYWLASVSGPRREIDGLEVYGSDPTQAHTTLHDAELPNGSIANTTYIPDATTAFHNYGVLWTADTITWYIDGVQVFQAATPADMHGPMDLIINLQLGAVGGPLDDSNLPSGFAIDYIRAYSLDAPGIPVIGKTVTGTAGPDSLVGGDGPDTLNGAGGVDTLAGGKGDDVYYVDNSKDVVNEANGAGTDVVYASVSWTATAGSDIEKVVATGTGLLNLTGNGQPMELDGNAGQNVLDDGGGADTLVGGQGNDTYIVRNAATVVTEVVGGGYDTVKTTLSTYAMPAGVEVLKYIGTGDFHGIGNAASNLLSGGAGDDTLDGGAGADRLVGGQGDDTYFVDSYGEAVIENAGEGRDTVNTTLASYSTPANIEVVNYIGTGTFIGHASDAGVSMTGGAGADALYGGAGNDTLAGGGGSDVLKGGDGADDFILNAPGAGVDRIMDFTHGVDQVVLKASLFGISSLSNVAFVNGSSAGAAGAPALVYDATGKLYFDADATHHVLIATFDGHPALSASDFLLG